MSVPGPVLEIPAAAAAHRGASMRFVQDAAEKRVLPSDSTPVPESSYPLPEKVSAAAERFSPISTGPPSVFVNAASAPCVHDVTADAASSQLDAVVFQTVPPTEGSQVNTGGSAYVLSSTPAATGCHCEENDTFDNG